MSTHVLRFTIDDVDTFDVVDRVVSRRIRHYTGWDQAKADEWAESNACRVTLTAIGDPPIGRARQRFRAWVEVEV